MSLQKIFFGPPGCGKSFHVRKVAIEDLEITGTREDLDKSQDMIETAFHPEYGYGDFVAKLMPLTENGHIEYRIHAGPLVKVLARAYADPKQPVLLVIDEINRGNCAQIFGDIFQLLDRDDKGWSEYGINPSELFKAALKQELLQEYGKSLTDLPDELKSDDRFSKLLLPPNLSLIGTMNTSDESVYYMDTAFKRRWEFEFMTWSGTDNAPEWQKNAKVQGRQAQYNWYVFLEKLNAFISEKFKERSVDDKQVGLWFLKAKKSTPVVTQTKSSEKSTIPLGMVLSEKHQNLIALLTPLIGKSKWSDWQKIYPEEERLSALQDIDLECEKAKPVLEKEYDVDLTGFSKFKYPQYFAKNLIEYISDKYGTARTATDKSISIDIADSQGEESTIELFAIKNKLMFFLWDNVFPRDRTPLAGLLGKDKNELRTFGEFSSDGNVTAFIDGVMAWPKEKSKPT
ncbi:MAG: AAA family ATPase [Sideroxydans sp.]|nr:AAA family ATPase [Sideroxydans sp.]